METIGRYQIKEPIGQGGMATVYRAHDPAVKRDVAIKLLPQQLLLHEKLRQRFLMEARTIANLENEAIVPLYDYGEQGGQPFLVMRLMSGGSLLDRIANGPLPLAEITAIMNRIGAALDAVHARGIIHRDLKPANILFDGQNKAYLSDFGIVKLLDHGGGLTGSHIIGTPSYMSPEQISGEELNHRSDIYSLGVILYQMMTGELPFKADTPFALAMKHQQAAVPSVLALNPELPPACETIIRKAMAKNPARRFNSAGEMAAALRQLQEPLTTTRPHAPRPAPATVRVGKKGRRSIGPAWMWGVISLLIVSTVAVGFLLSGLIPGSRSAAGATGTPSPTSGAETPVISPPPSQPVLFDAEEYGILLLVDGEEEVRQSLLPLLEADLRATLVETGVGGRTAVAAREKGTGNLAEAADTSGARLVIYVMVLREGQGYLVSAGSHVADPLVVAGVDVVGGPLLATADAMLVPYSAASMAEIGEKLADRTAVIVNAAFGFTALYEGQHSECTRRLTAVLALLEQIDVVSNRAEASHASLGTCMAALGQEEAAREHFEAALAINPNYALAYYGLGNYHYRRTEYAEAQRLYEQTIAVSFADPLASDEIVGRAYVGLGNIAIAEGRYEEAIEALTEAISIQPDFPAYYLARAIAGRALGQMAEAEADLQRCLELAVSDEPVQSDYYRELQETCETLLVETPVPATDVPVVTPGQPLLTIGVATANVRSGPGTNYPAVAVLTAGQAVVVLARDPAGQWFNVQLPTGARGWLHNSVGTLSGVSGPGAIPVAATVPAAPPPTAVNTPPPTIPALATATQPPTIPATEPAPLPPTATATQPPTVPPPATATQPPTVPAPTATQPPTVPPPPPTPTPGAPF